MVDTTADSYRTQPPRDKHDPDPAGFRYLPRAGTAYELEHGVALKRRHYLTVLWSRLVDQIVEHCPALWSKTPFRTHVGAIIAKWNAKTVLDWVRSVIH